MQQLPSGFRRFLQDERGNVFIIIGLGILPALGIVALGVDYSVTLTAKAKLDEAYPADSGSSICGGKVSPAI